jgi:hypothetical protein
VLYKELPIIFEGLCMFWNLVAKILAIEWVADALIRRAMKTEYFHLPGYMNRWWLFNGYKQGDPLKKRPHPWWPYAYRIHHILRADLDKWPHDHPADARTFLLKGWYYESRDDAYYLRKAGESGAIKYGEYHSIDAVSEGGVWTLFVLGPRKGEWGFRVDGVKIPWYQYLKSPDDPRDGSESN